MEFLFYLACLAILAFLTVACSTILVLNPENIIRLFLLSSMNNRHWVTTVNFQENYYLQAYSIPIIDPIIAKMISFIPRWLFRSFVTQYGNIAPSLRSSVDLIVFGMNGFRTLAIVAMRLFIATWLKQENHNVILVFYICCQQKA